MVHCLMLQSIRLPISSDSSNVQLYELLDLLVWYILLSTETIHLVRFMVLSPQSVAYTISAAIVACRVEHCNASTQLSIDDAMSYHL